MSTHYKAMMKEGLARLTLQYLSSASPLKDFSWNRVRIALLNISRCDATYNGDYLVLNFLFHQHSLWLDRFGRGILYNPWREGSPKYTFVMPAEIQKLVQEAWDTYKAPIPINPSSN